MAEFHLVIETNVFIRKSEPIESLKCSIDSADMICVGDAFNHIRCTYSETKLLVNEIRKAMDLWPRTVS